MAGWCWESRDRALAVYANAITTNFVIGKTHIPNLLLFTILQMRWYRCKALKCIYLFQRFPSSYDYICVCSISSFLYFHPVWPDGENILLIDVQKLKWSKMHKNCQSKLKILPNTENILNSGQKSLKFCHFGKFSLNLDALIPTFFLSVFVYLSLCYTFPRPT